MTDPALDLQAAHRYFSGECFNRTWDLIDKPKRTAEEDAAMIHTCLASLWHWSQRSDCKPANLSIGYWQAARVFALARDAEAARRYAQLCLEASRGEGPFLVGYAYEALARAEKLAGNKDKASAHLAEARRWADQIPDEENKKALLNDLKTV
jgi:hypothetical protein